MSNNRDNYWNDEEEDDDIDTPPQQYADDSDLVRKFRKDNRNLAKRNKELESKYAELLNSNKERIIKDVLTSKGVRPSIAKYIPSDVEPTPEAIASWLDSNAEDFGISLEKKTEVNPVDVENLKKMDAVTTGAEGSVSSDSVEQRLSEATSAEEVLSILSGN